MPRQLGFSLLLALLSLFFLTCGVADAQTTGDIQGKVTETSGTPLPGVTLEATSPRLQGTRVTVSGHDGKYRFPGVPPGEYQVRGTLENFDPVQEATTVALDATATLDLTMRLSARESVLVSGEAPLIDLTSTTTGTNYTSKVIAKLPVARNYADIVRSNPGVFVDRGDTQGRSLALAIYGATSVENQWIIDGVNTTNVIRGFQGKAINNEFVQEVEVKTGSYQAEYGRALGGIINVITKSGGNEFHGDAFVYYDSQDLKADEVITGEDSLVGRMRVSDYRRTDLGLDLGGRIVKDRLWFFAAYNRIDLPAKVSRYESSDLVQNTLQFPLDGTDNLYSGKLTWNAATGTTFVATVFADPTTNSGAGASDPRQTQRAIRLITNPDPGTWEADRKIGGTDYGLRWNQLFGSRALVTMQGSRHEDRFELTPAGAGSEIRLNDLTCSGGTPEDPCRRPAFPNFGTGGLGLVYGPLNRSSSYRNQYDGDVTVYLGNHEIKLGGDYEDAATDATTSFSGGQLVQRRNEWGQTYYRHQFFARSTTDFTPVDSVAKGSVRDVGAFLQDSWKAAPGLTVNAGLRWDEEDIRDYQGETTLKTTNEWQPRLGVVWDPKRDGRTKVYAFAGRFYYALPTDLVIRSYGNQVFIDTFNFDPVDVAHDGNVLNHEEFFAPGSSAYATPVDEGIKGGYQDELTVGIERLIDPTLSVGLKGTYRTLGRVIEDRCDLDYTRPETGYSGCGIYNVGSGGRIARGDLPGCSGFHGDDPDTYPCTETIPATPPIRRLFRGVEVFGRKAFGESLWLQASYLYSSLRGNYDGGVSAGGQTDPGIQADFDYAEMVHNSYGRLYLDRPHSFRFDGYYATPFKLFVGLQGHVQSGAPRSRYGYLNQWYIPPSVQLVPRGTDGRLPTVWEANLTLGYPFQVGPATVTVQAYVFNLFNNQIVTARDDVWSDVAPPDYPSSVFDPNQEQNNPEYGKVTSRQEPRFIRGSLKISF